MALLDFTLTSHGEHQCLAWTHLTLTKLWYPSPAWPSSWSRDQMSATAYDRCTLSSLRSSGPLLWRSLGYHCPPSELPKSWPWFIFFSACPSSGLPMPQQTHLTNIWLNQWRMKPWLHNPLSSLYVLILKHKNGQREDTGKSSHIQKIVRRFLE